MWHHHPGLYQLFDDGTNLSSSPGAAVLLSACHDRGGSSRAPALPSYWPRSCAREPRKVLPAAECVVPVHIQELKKRGPGEPLRQPTGSRSGEDAVTGTPRRSGGPRRRFVAPGVNASAEPTSNFPWRDARISFQILISLLCASASSCRCLGDSLKGFPVVPVAV